MLPIVTQLFTSMRDTAVGSEHIWKSLRLIGSFQERKNSINNDGSEFCSEPFFISVSYYCCENNETVNADVFDAVASAISCYD